MSYRFSVLHRIYCITAYGNSMLVKQHWRCAYFELKQSKNKYWVLKTITVQGMVLRVEQNGENPTLLSYSQGVKNKQGKLLYNESY